MTGESSKIAACLGSAKYSISTSQAVLEKKRMCEMVYTPLLLEERTFKNAKAENVLNYVRVQIEGRARLENLRNEYEGEDGKQYAYEYKFEKVSAPQNNKVELKAIYTIQPKGGKPKNPLGKKPIVVWRFIVYQLQNDTVLLRMFYRQIGLNAMLTLKLTEDAFTVENKKINQVDRLIEINAPPIYLDDLSDTEKFVMQGLTDEQIATRLQKSVSTVKRYRKKLGIKKKVKKVSKK